LSLHEQDAVKWIFLCSTRASSIVQEGRETGRLISASLRFGSSRECASAYLRRGGGGGVLTRHPPSLRQLCRHISGCWPTATKTSRDQRRRHLLQQRPVIGGAHSADVAHTHAGVLQGQARAWVGGLTHVMRWEAPSPVGPRLPRMSRYGRRLDLPAQKVARTDKFFQLLPHQREPQYPRRQLVDPG